MVAPAVIGAAIGAGSKLLGGLFKLGGKSQAEMLQDELDAQKWMAMPETYRTNLTPEAQEYVQNLFASFNEPSAIDQSLVASREAAGGHSSELIDTLKAYRNQRAQRQEQIFNAQGAV